jgi:YD repeat-containing protein
MNPDKSFDSNCQCGNPVDPATGLKLQNEFDYHAPGGLELVRRYNSLSTENSAQTGSLGSGGWRLGWQRSIQGATSAVVSQLRTIPLAGSVLAPYGTTIPITANQIYTAPSPGALPIIVAYVTRDSGTTYTFNLVNGVWQSDADVNDQLTSQPNASGGINGWTYTTADKSVEQYSPTGQLLSVTDRAGQITILSYSDGTATAPNGGYVLDATGTPTATVLPYGQLVGISDAYGRKLSLGYDANSRVVQVTDPAGGIYHYAYDSNSNLISVSYPDGKSRQYVYENASFPYALTGIIDEDGNRYATFAYDSSGRAISTQHAGGAELFSFAYNSNSTTGVTDALNTTRTLTFQATQGVLKLSGTAQPAGSGSAAASNALTYDTNGNVSSRTDFNGNQSTYTYDLVRNLELSRTEGLTSAGAKTAATRTILTTWHPTYRLPLSIVEQNTSGTSAVTLRTTTLGYDAAGNLLTRTITDGLNPAITRTDTYTYDNLGHRLTADGPRTDVSDITQYAYDAQGNLTTVTDALNHVTTLAGYDANGRPGSLTDPNGLVTSFTYDPRGRLLSKNTGGELTSYTYDGAGNLTHVALPAGAAYTYTYDAAHRLTQIADASGNYTIYTLDNADNRIKEQLYNSSGTLVQTHSRVFDALNRLYQDIGAVNQTTTYAYDANGNLINLSDPLSRSTVNAYDALNRLVSSTDPSTGKTSYGINALDQLTGVTDPRNLVTQYTRDGLGNLDKQVSPDTGTTTNTFDAAGNLLTRTDAKGQLATYTYDALNRLTKISYTGGTSPAQTVTYLYDQGTNGIGHLSSITDSTGTASYSYDQHGRLLSETDQAYGATYTTSYSYDTQGRLAGMTYPSGRTISYTFDMLGRVNQISTTLNGTTNILASNIVYQPFGGVQSFNYGDGVTPPVQSYIRQLDQDGRIASYTLNGKAMSIGYDAASQISFVSDPTNLANTANYGYDLLSRLTGFTLGATSQSFAYDADGNRTSQTIGSTSSIYGYATTGNALTSIQTGVSSPKPLTQDANGSTLSDPARQYAYDLRGRLIQTVTAQGTINYELNALGQRVRKQVPYASTDTEYHYDMQGHLIGENATGTTQFSREYIYLGNQPVAVMQ